MITSIKEFIYICKKVYYEYGKNDLHCKNIINAMQKDIKNIQYLSDTLEKLSLDMDNLLYFALPLSKYDYIKQFHSYIVHGVLYHNPDTKYPVCIHNTWGANPAEEYRAIVRHMDDSIESLKRYRTEHDYIKFDDEYDRIRSKIISDLFDAELFDKSYKSSNSYIKNRLRSIGFENIKFDNILDT